MGIRNSGQYHTVTFLLSIGAKEAGRVLPPPSRVPGNIQGWVRFYAPCASTAPSQAHEKLKTLASSILIFTTINIRLAGK
jgi:hypothetical protein